MQIEPVAVLALISDLYSQIGDLAKENAELRKQLHRQDATREKAE